MINRLILFVAVLLPVLLLLGCRTTPTETCFPGYDIDSLESAYQFGKFFTEHPEETIRQASICIDKSQLPPERLSPAYLLRGSAHTKLKAYSKAFDDFDKAIELKPSWSHAFERRGTAHVAAGNLEEAMQDFNKSIALDPNNALAFTGRAILYAKMEDIDKSIEDLNRVIALDPPYIHHISMEVEIYAVRGQLYARKGEHHKALRDYAKAIEIAPRKSETYLYRGLTLFAMAEDQQAIGKYDRAITLYTKARDDMFNALTLRPNYKKAQAWRGKIQARISDAQLAKTLEDDSLFRMPEIKF